MKATRLTALTLLTVGFLWLGLPRCSEVEAMEASERLWVDVLCQRVRAEYFFEPEPGRLSVSEWREVLRAYREADVLEDEDDAVMERLVSRLRGR